jgi:hypothetical protein
MANVVRLVNGGQIQVRTGVLQGIGPEGPRGVMGLQGIQGVQGIQGDPGPIGQILNRAALTRIAIPNTITAAVDTLVNWGSVLYDDFGGSGASGVGFSTSNTGFTMAQAGDYQFSSWLRFDDGPATAREIWFQVGSTLIARKSVMAGSGAQFYIDLTFPYRAAAGETVSVYCRAGSNSNVGAGAWGVVRTGSGPQGPVGPPGPQGLQGQKGDDGDANSGFATYAEMLPH